MSQQKQENATKHTECSERNMSVLINRQDAKVDKTRQGVASRVHD
jgi:hypothetical protein